jgi:serine/threonine-protein kinase
MLPDGYTEVAVIRVDYAGGRVVEARDQATGRTVTITLLPPMLASDAMFMERLQRDLEIARELDQANIAELLACIEERGGVFLVTEHITGMTLRQLIDSGATITPEMAARVLRGALLGLEAVHGAGLGYAECQPSSVLVNRTGTCKLLDLIAAPAVGGTRSASAAAYRAPEQLPTGEPTVASALYSLTAMVFEFLTGQPPYAGDAIALRAQHQKAPIPLQEVPEPFRALIGRGMAKLPGDRWVSAAEYRGALEAAATEAFGERWEEHGRIGLAAAVAALDADASASGVGTSQRDSAPGSGKRSRRRAADAALALVLVLSGAGLAAAAGLGPFHRGTSSGVAGVTHGPRSDRSGSPSDGGAGLGVLPPSESAATTPTASIAPTPRPTATAVAVSVAGHTLTAASVTVGSCTFAGKTGTTTCPITATFHYSVGGGATLQPWSLSVHDFCVPCGLTYTDFSQPESAAAITGSTVTVAGQLAFTKDQTPGDCQASEVTLVTVTLRSAQSFYGVRPCH